MKQSQFTIMSLLVCLTVASCGSSAQFAQQRFQDGIYRSTSPQPEEEQYAVLSREDIERMAAEQIEKDRLASGESLSYSDSDDRTVVNLYLVDPWLYTPLSCGRYWDRWYWNRWHLGTWYDPYWSFSFYYDWYSPWYCGGWYDPWYGPYYDPWYGPGFWHGPHYGPYPGPHPGHHPGIFPGGGPHHPDHGYGNRYYGPRNGTQSVRSRYITGPSNSGMSRTPLAGGSAGGSFISRAPSGGSQGSVSSGSSTSRGTVRGLGGSSRSSAVSGTSSGASRSSAVSGGSGVSRGGDRKSVV